MQFDVAIVGSGPAGVHAAYPLVKAGLRVAIIDGSLEGKKQDTKVSDFSEKNFSSAGHAYDILRKSSYVFNKTYQLLKIRSEIEIIQTLAKGGLSQVWDGICDFFSKDELEKVGLPFDEIQNEYKEIARLIRLKREGTLDVHGTFILDSAKKREDLKNTVYQLPFVISYKTSNVIEGLKRSKNFSYIPNQLVFTVRNKSKSVEIKSFSIETMEESSITARFLILAAGSINSTRILLRSFNLFNYKTSFLTKAHTLIACLHPKILFQKNKIGKVRTGQLAISSNEIDRGLGKFFVQLYRFNPQSLSKALKYIPLPKVIANKMLSIILPFLVVADVRFPAFESAKNFCRLQKNGKEDILEIFFKNSKSQLKDYKRQLNKITQQLHSFGLFPIRTINDYTTAHYAGGVPYQPRPGKLSVDKSGRLHQGNRIYVADSSTWRALPAKSPTLTIMANASRVAKNVLRNFD